MGVGLLGLSHKEFWELTIAELNEKIKAFAKYKKQDNERDFWRSASICAVIANANRDPKKKPRPYQPKDFMPKEKKPMTPEQIEAFLKALTLAMGGEVIE